MSTKCSEVLVSSQMYLLAHWEDMVCCCNCVIQLATFSDKNIFLHFYAKTKWPWHCLSSWNAGFALAQCLITFTVPFQPLLSHRSSALYSESRISSFHFKTWDCLFLMRSYETMYTFLKRGLASSIRQYHKTRKSVCVWGRVHIYVYS